MRRGMTRTELVVVVLVIAVVAAVMMGVVNTIQRAQEMARQACCASDLKMIGLALKMYAQDYDDLLPISRDASQMQIAVDPYLRNRSLFCCPTDPACRAAARAYWTAVRLGLPPPPKTFPAIPSYEWNPALAGRDVTKAPASTWAVRDRVPWHRGHRNAVFVDGTVRQGL
jgi:type II secretory pathway pseudopilin PulG